MWKFIVERGTGIATGVFALAAQVSGFTNIAIAAGLLAVAAFFFVAPLCHHAHAWHKRRIEAGLKSVDAFHLIIVGLSGIIIFAAVALIGVFWNFAGQSRAPAAINSTSVRTVGATEPEKPPVQGSPTNVETKLRLQFGASNTLPIATELQNIWRWYALANVVVLQGPEGQQRELKTWNIFLTLEKPVDVKQVLVEAKGNPRFEVKDTNSRSVVIAFMSDLVDVPVEIKIISDPTIAAPIPPQASPSAAPPIAKSKPHYDAEEIREMLATLRALDRVIDEKYAPSQAALNEIIVHWDQRVRADLSNIEIDEVRRLREQLVAARSEILQIFSKGSFYENELASLKASENRANSSMQSALDQFIKDVSELLKYPGVDLLKFARPSLNQMQAINSQMREWVRLVKPAIQQKTAELRDWKNP